MSKDPEISGSELSGGGASPLLRNWVYAFVALTWIVRFVFLTNSSMMNADEWSLWKASDHTVAYDFFHSPNWAEKWEIIERLSFGGRIFWIFFHLLAAYIFPAGLNAAFGLSVFWGLVAMFSAAGAARRLYGERAYLLCLVVVAASPYLLNYSLRVVGTVQSVAWLCAALYFFSSRKWSAFSWMAGGLCFGLSFGAHYGTGAAVVSISAGLGASVVSELRRRDLSWGAKSWRCFVLPALGAAAALTPLLLLEFWARRAGSSYLHRLTHHENLTEEGQSITYGNWFETLGPHGMWLRYLFEFEPIFQVGFFAAAGCTFRAGWIPRRTKIALGILYAALFAVLANGMGLAIPRAWASILIFGSAGVLIFALQWMGRGGQTPDSETQSDESPSRAPYGQSAMIVSAIILITIFTCWRNVSAMPRHIFAGWPVFVLAFTGLIATVMRKSLARATAGAIAIGGVIFVLGAAGTYISKSASYRQNTFGRTHPGFINVFFANLLIDNYGYDKWWKRASDEVHVFGPSLRLYPASSYDEELFKVIDLGTKLKLNDLDRLVTTNEYFNAEALIVEGDIQNKTIPPPETPLVPEEFGGSDARNNPFKPRTHEYRGIEMPFSPSRNGDQRELSVWFDLKGEAGKPTAFGFEYMGVGVKSPPGTTLKLEVFRGEESIAKLNIPIQPVAVNFEVFQTQLTPSGEKERFRVKAELTCPSGMYCAPVTCYIRRPFIQTPFLLPKRTATSGYAGLIESDRLDPNFILPDGRPTKFAYTEASCGLEGKGVRWTTAPWSGKSDDKIVFLCSVRYWPKVRLSVNGRDLIDFKPLGSFLAWENKNVALQFWNIGAIWGSNGLVTMRLRDGIAPAGKPLELCLRIVAEKADPKKNKQATNPMAGIGVHEITDAPGMLPP